MERGGGAAPSFVAPPSGPLQAAELDAPGFLLTVLQATDPDDDPLYYDIIGTCPLTHGRFGSRTRKTLQLSDVDKKT